ncbi:MAG: copper resistance protein CopC [Mycobacterium sp.]|nr:copper resistance protein CopC [Mycobacterium sp.]
MSDVPVGTILAAGLRAGSPPGPTWLVNALLRWLAAGVLAVLMLIGAGAGIAQAHPTLLVTDPATETAVASSPEAITLLFNEPVTIGDRAIVLLDQAGREVPTRPATHLREGRAVTTRSAQPLAPGTYTVRWRATGSDGDQVEQEFRFAVGVALSGSAAGAGSPPAWGEAALRWLLFAGLAIAAGGLIAQRFTATARAEQPALPPLRPWVPAALLLALAGVAGLILQRVIDAGQLAAAWEGRAAVALLAEAAGLVAALKLGRWALTPLAVVIAAEGIRSHAGVNLGIWGAVLTAVHLAAVTVWVGALLHTVRAMLTWRRAGAAVRWVLASYVRLALWTYVVMVTTGVASLLVLVPLPQLVSTSYGRVLLIKLGLVVAVSAAALSARLIFRDAARSARLRGLMAAESGVLLVVLVVSAVLVSTPPPTAAASAGVAPQPVGPVVPLGALAGQIGISVSASDGLVVVRLSTPRRGDYYTTQPDQAYTLAASLGATALAPSGCGTGCFYARPRWPRRRQRAHPARRGSWLGGRHHGRDRVVAAAPRGRGIGRRRRGDPLHGQTDRLRNSHQRHQRPSPGAGSPRPGCQLLPGAGTLRRRHGADRGADLTAGRAGAPGAGLSRRLDQCCAHPR